MNNNKTFFSAILISLLFSVNPTRASEGANLFKQYCTRCHQSAAMFSTPPDQIASLLKAGTIRQHRFTLDENTVQSIVTYIKEQNP